MTPNKQLWNLVEEFREDARRYYRKHREFLIETRKIDPNWSGWWTPLLAVSQQYDECADRLERVLKGKDVNETKL